MNVVEIQRVCESPGLPTSDQMQEWAAVVLENRIQERELVIRIVDQDESAALNLEYRKKQGPTNVLSFTYEPVGDRPVKLLGDVVICASIVEKEASEQHKGLDAHWAHMVVHGLLHLLGYDHIEESDAFEMETLELEILTKMGYPNPYQEVVNP